MLLKKTWDLQTFYKIPTSSTFFTALILFFKYSEQNHKFNCYFYKNLCKKQITSNVAIKLTKLQIICNI